MRKFRLIIEIEDNELEDNYTLEQAAIDWRSDLEYHFMEVAFNSVKCEEIQPQS